MSVESEAGPEPRPPPEIKSEPEPSSAAIVASTSVSVPPEAKIELEQPPFALDEESHGSFQEELGPGLEEAFPVAESAPLDSQEDDVGLFMRAMAQTMRRLPVRQRAVLKYQIHAVVHKAELEFYNDWSLS